MYKELDLSMAPHHVTISPFSNSLVYHSSFCLSQPLYSFFYSVFSSLNYSFNVFICCSRPVSVLGLCELSVSFSFLAPHFSKIYIFPIFSFFAHQLLHFSFRVFYIRHLHFILCLCLCFLFCLPPFIHCLYCSFIIIPFRSSFNCPFFPSPLSLSPIFLSLSLY